MRLIHARIAALAVVASLAVPSARAQTGAQPQLPYVSVIRTEPARPCAKLPTTLVLEGFFRDGCGQLVFQSEPGAPIELTLKVGVGPDTACTLGLKPWSAHFPLGPLPAGHHVRVITLHVIDWDQTRGEFVRQTYQARHEFDVTAECDPLPPPGPLPYVKFIHIGPARNCSPEVCAGESIRVTIGGEFPDDCFMFRRIELIGPLVLSPIPQPQIVRVIVDQRACLGRVCLQRPVPWSGSVTLPPLPARDYRLLVELARVNCSETYPPGDLFSTEAPFRVVADCPPLPPCLTASFGSTGGIGACDATVAPSEPAVLRLRIAPSVALAGLEGGFRIEPAGLAITKIEAIGPAKGMILNWSAHPGGAQFNLFATSGAPIPPAVATVYPPGSDVLQITLEQKPDEPIADRTLVRAEQLLGSDARGEAIEYCPPPPCAARDPADLRLAQPMAVVCARQACDFSGDGREDVRDLVRMVRCLNAEDPCPDDVDARFDCDGDEVFALSDVICCARHILRKPPCPDCPPGAGTPRPEPDVRLSFGPPVSGEGATSLPLRIHGADRIGAAMLTLDVPLDRYDLDRIDGVSDGWMTLHETRQGRLVVGLLATGGGAGASLDLTLRLALRPGETPGGAVTAVAAEFSGGDGELLAVNLGTPSGALPGPARIALSGNHPNPFSTETRFTIELTQPAHVVVGIYDLRGRAMATLHNGRLPSGPKELVWNGRGTDGNRAPNGVYFYRVVADGRTIARKLIVMRVE